MTAAITHTPFDGTSKPFAIGLKQAEPRDWIELDRHLEAYLAEKDRLYSELPDKVFVAEPETRAAQQEVLDLLVAHLTERFPGTYHLEGGRCAIAGTDRSIDVAAPGDNPLIAASKLVQEDLILMRQGADGWRLAAGSLCFPSSWRLTEKFGKAIHDIHGPVPGFGPGTRMAELIARMFDKLAVLVERFNWSVQANGELYHPLSDRQRLARSAETDSTFPGADVAGHAFIRVERQTLRKLPASGDILFTIRIHLDPLAVLARHPDRATLAASFVEQLTGLDRDQLDYKGLAADRDRLVAFLNGMARAG
ncbi:heme-dependent oxidative N-demethylase family protein [Aminobacter sp. Piv2-1]|uniref:heme-dependent oxidative N-demethylase family protein n=1 Tax=Aminobacter sp. Piv2-1 TaxID=3031122 RepID=UPI0030B5FAB6